MTLHKELKKVRKELGWTQEYMANKLGITREHYCKVEGGVSNPTIALLESIEVLSGKRLLILYIDRD